MASRKNSFNDKSLNDLEDKLALFLKEAGAFTWHSLHVTRAFFPLVSLLASPDNITAEELSEVIDNIFASLYKHPVMRHSRYITDLLRRKNIIPNEKTTEGLIRFLVDQAVLRSPVKVPKVVIDEFWTFFDELFSEPELKGLAELNLDIVRVILKSYEPLFVDAVNMLKEGYRLNKSLVSDFIDRMNTVRGDIAIIRRQARALRYIKPFFQTDPKDFKTQARIIAKMVREFGPFFIKMAQVAAANSDFLPEEISRELMVFQEDVPPMSAEEVCEAFESTIGKKPYECYFDFNVDKPLKSGSIGSVYLAKKPVLSNGREVLKPVIIKVARAGIEREFLLGRTVLGVAIISSHYWAPHSKLAPFLEAMQQQADEFTKGFLKEIDFVQEAENQRRFAERCKNSMIWNVPEVYFVSKRIIEMEYIENAAPISRVLNYIPEKKRERNARLIASRFLYTILLHAFVYQEFHGDLHPGNVLFNAEGDMYFIDWGNCVNMKGKWKPLWDYVSGALIADVDLLSDALINISADPEKNRKRKKEIRATLEQTLINKGVTPLGRNFLFQLRREGLEGIRKRLHVTLHLMSNTQHLGLVVKSEYLHISRSIAAIVGTYLHLYRGISRLLLLVDSIRTIAQLPISIVLDRIADRRSAVYIRMILKFPLLVGMKNPSPLYLTEDHRFASDSFPMLRAEKSRRDRDIHERRRMWN